ncbi:putative retrotransposable element tf2 155 kda protein type 1-like [Lyophyllum shimeji]|uniref:Retrotransposable element tf2 155 kDa protein type 1-like n=1 Tax=Lyophyllum shimeji TaxID=47721 RepID=A0A9P3Q241_LYOSH|nr:putative retrotransposable element tf2 155 kda protein type 1-like [Lyophyllum shimeji]
MPATWSASSTADILTPQAGLRDVPCGPGGPASHARFGASGRCTLEGGDMYSIPEDFRIPPAHPAGLRTFPTGLRAHSAGLRAHSAGLLVPPPSDPGFAAHRCATSAARYYTVFTRYCTVLPSHPIVVHTVRAPGKGSLDLFSLDLPLPASCESASVQGSPLQEWPIPKNKKEVQSFLGFTNFYRRFIHDFSHHARPLFDLTAKDVAWTWGSAQQDVFDALKRAITSQPVLIFPDDDRPFWVEADSSDFATGAVLSQQSPEDEKWHPVVFYSKSLNAVERNYEIHDKEMLAIIHALEEWRHFLEGVRHKVEIYMDHKNLQYFLTAKKLNRCQARWSLYLANFDFVLHHRPGRSMGKPDALSRRPDHGDGSSDNTDIVLLKPEFFAVRALQGLIAAGEENQILRDIRRGNREGAQEDVVAKAAAALKSARSEVRSVRSAEWSEDQGILMFRGRIYVPNVPELRRRIVEQHHDSRVAGHPGRWKTLELVSRSYWWPQMSRYIGSYTSTCDLCQRTKVRRQLPMGKLHPLPIPEGRWSIVSVDFIVELPKAHGYDVVMVVVDSVGKRAHFIPTHTTCTAMGAANLYRKHVWKLHGLPDAFISDRGPQFVAEFTRELYRLLSIKLSTSTAYHPQSDGQTERVNQKLEQYLRVFCNERQDDWDDLLPEAEF